MSSVKWDLFFLGMAKYVSAASKDPSTKCGSVIVRPNRTVASLGYNGFPRRVLDSDERYADREQKYKLVVHAEANAIVGSYGDVRGCTIYNWPLFSCCECAKLVIQSGIIRIVSPPPKLERWQSSYDAAQLMYKEAGIEVTFM